MSENPTSSDDVLPEGTPSPVLFHPDHISETLSIAQIRAMGKGGEIPADVFFEMMRASGIPAPFMNAILRMEQKRISLLGRDNALRKEIDKLLILIHNDSLEEVESRAIKKATLQKKRREEERERWLEAERERRRKEEADQDGEEGDQKPSRRSISSVTKPSASINVMITDAELRALRAGHVRKPSQASESSEEDQAKPPDKVGSVLSRVRQGISGMRIFGGKRASRTESLSESLTLMQVFERFKVTQSMLVDAGLSPSDARVFFGLQDCTLQIIRDETLPEAYGKLCDAFPQWRLPRSE